MNQSKTTADEFKYYWMRRSWSGLSLLKFRQFVKYSVNGGLGYVVDFSLILLFTRIGLDRYSASVLAYSIALVQTFLGSHFVVFKSAKSPRKTLLPYILLGAFCQSIALLMQALGAHLALSVAITRLLTYPLIVGVSLYTQIRIFNKKSRRAVSS